MSEPRPHPATSALVIAGGQSRRLGRDKRRLRLWGEHGPTLLEHTVALASRLSDDVVVVLNDPEHWPAIPARLVVDAYPDAGALGGLASGLAAARHDYSLALAADMPLLSLELLRAMLALPRDYDALVARVEADEPAAQRRNKLNVEPLHALYSQRCLAPMDARLRAGRYQIVGFFEDVRVRYLDPALLAAHDPQGHSFLSVNTPEQLARVTTLLKAP
jgi:molybdopterin-guanine dinucleotide biosynthesis protein A